MRIINNSEPVTHSVTGTTISVVLAECSLLQLLVNHVRHAYEVIRCQPINMSVQ